MKITHKVGESISAFTATLRSAATRKEQQLRGTSRSARRINALVREIGATSYLEIGVHKGATFLAVDAPKKVAVDPRLQFDWSSKQTELVRFYKIPSDEWFLKHAGDERFDIIFLDGLHTFEQTFRDFCNSLLISHARTVWVIDDTMPGDIYSASPNHRMAAELRRKEAGQDVPESRLGGWSGDVFKVVFAIHDFFPMLTYRTIFPPGNPQTVVWRQPRLKFAPLFNNLEAISRLSYFDYRANLQALQGGTEEEVLQMLSESFAKTHAATTR